MALVVNNITIPDTDFYLRIVTNGAGIEDVKKWNGVEWELLYHFRQKVWAWYGGTISANTVGHKIGIATSNNPIVGQYAARLQVQGSTTDYLGSYLTINTASGYLASGTSTATDPSGYKLSITTTATSFDWDFYRADLGNWASVLYGFEASTISYSPGTFTGLRKLNGDSAGFYTGSGYIYPIYNGVAASSSTGFYVHTYA